MSGAKFASITADLLARKGEARPWRDLETPDKTTLSWRGGGIGPAVNVAPPPPPLSRDKSCTVRMSAHDYERLGIIAVKAAMSRHQLLKEALAQFIAARAQDYSCACLGDCQRNCGNQS
jgi:hypothetical protein